MTMFELHDVDGIVGFANCEDLGEGRFRIVGIPFGMERLNNRDIVVTTGNSVAGAHTIGQG